MLRYVLRRAVQMVPVLVLISVISFAITFVLPGDPALAILGENNVNDQQLYQQLRQSLGLDQPVPIQYAEWLGRLAHGNFGTSIATKQPVGTLLVQRLPPTIELGVLGLLFSMAVAIPAGVVSAIRPNSRFDLVGTVAAISGASVPIFWLGLLLILLFALRLRWLPASGYISPTQNLGDNLKLMIMPTIALGSGSAALLMRQTRSAMLEVLGQEYVRTARAKGLRERVVTMRHSFRNALIPIVTVLGLQIGLLLSGAAITESIFAIPGVGRLAVDSIFNRDFPVLQAVVLITAFAVLIANLLTDLAYAWLDPRIRYQ